ncbi:GTP-binding protein [Gymnopus androsaceus JB14]|uniref:GTP-binding protein n=1 Tax=Gymnopus androsaceus JB14 TaxID=1447944 RepID=A0A6A4GQ59_9AGAR|nr:GTP-binding protein [Gymnopus androsaceus JB14]
MLQDEPTSAPSSADIKRAQKVREKCGRFRILTIGRANAGKTTVLQRICNTTEQPEIYDSKGVKIENSVVAPSAARGSHDIENELVFRSNAGFIFHDSRGFEAGGATELDQVKVFIEEHSKQKVLQDQVHAIWYCIPMDDSRPFTAAEKAFFSDCGTGRVPVIAIFTKFDALDNKAYRTLIKENISRKDARAQAPRRAVDDFEKSHLDDIYSRQYPPKGHVYLRDMNKPEAKCPELTAQTAAVLDGKVLQQLFVSTQQNNLELCIEYAVKQ